MRNVLVAVPTRGAIGWQTVTRLQEIARANPSLPPVLWQPGNLSVALTRNVIVQRFLASSCDTLVMVDDDVVPPPTMLDHLVPVPDGFGMVGIPHPMPVPGAPSSLTLTAFRSDGDGLRVVQELEPGWNDVDAVATGCVAIPRAVLERLGPNPFRISNDPAAAVTSDDFLFCADLRAADFRVGAWWDGWYCDHITAVSLAPLLEGQARQTTATVRKEKVR